MNEEILTKKVEQVPVGENEMENKIEENIGETQTPEISEEKIELNSDSNPENVISSEDEILSENVISDENISDNMDSSQSVTFVDSNGETEEKIFTQSQANDMMGRTRQETRNRTLNFIYDRYGVNNEEELDELVGNAQRYDSLSDEYQDYKKQTSTAMMERDAELNNIKEQLAMLQSGIDKERYEDAKYILKGKGLEINMDNINAELASHPEWKKSEMNNPDLQGVFKPVLAEEMPSKLTRPEVLGNDLAQGNKAITEEEQVMKMFKI